MNTHISIYTPLIDELDLRHGASVLRIDVLALTTCLTKTYFSNHIYTYTYIYIYTHMYIYIYE
jgi:hypothetical protein